MTARITLNEATYTIRGRAYPGTRAPNRYEQADEDWAEIESVVNEAGEDVTGLLDEEDWELCERKLIGRARYVAGMD